MSAARRSQGIRVADFTWVWAGPFCTLQLAHLGAEVIRVETSTRICVTRLLPPFADFEMGPNRSGYFNQYNQGKKSLALDMKRPEALDGREAPLRRERRRRRELRAPASWTAWGSATTCCARSGPTSIMIALSGYGATGPDARQGVVRPGAGAALRHVVAHGLPRLPADARRHLLRRSDRRPARRGRRARRAACIAPAPAEGQYIDLSQWETSIAVLGRGRSLAQTHRHGAPARDGNRDPVHGAARRLPRRRRGPLDRDRRRGRRRLGALRGVHRPSRARDAIRASRRSRPASSNEDALDEVVTAWTASAEPRGRDRDAAGRRHRAPSSRQQPRPRREPASAARAASSSSIDHPEVGTPRARRRALAA